MYLRREFTSCNPSLAGELHSVSTLWITVESYIVFGRDLLCVSLRECYVVLVSNENYFGFSEGTYFVFPAVFPECYFNSRGFQIEFLWVSGGTYFLFLCASTFGSQCLTLCFLGVVLCFYVRFIGGIFVMGLEDLPQS